MSEEQLNADALAFLREVFLRDGTEAAEQAAKDMISAGAAWLAQEHGPDEAADLAHVGAAQGEGSLPNASCRPRRRGTARTLRTGG